MRVLWQGEVGKKVWRLGELTPGKDGHMPKITIDHVWDDKGDHLGHVRDCDHHEKIVIYGDDCATVAQRVVDALNAA